MALKLDLCRIIETRELPWASGITSVREGQPLVRVYESGSERGRPSNVANSAVGFAGIAYSSETAISRWPKIETLTLAAGGGVQTPSLSKTPADRTNALAIFNSSGTAVMVSTDGTPAANEIDVSATGVINTHSGIAAGAYTFVYEYAPTALEARILQGDTEPGQHVTSELRSTSAIVRGDVYTTEWDIDADWDDANAALGVRMTADGRFTIGAAAAVGSRIPGIDVIQYPTSESEFLGLRLA